MEKKGFKMKVPFFKKDTAPESIEDTPLRRSGKKSAAAPDDFSRFLLEKKGSLQESQGEAVGSREKNNSKKPFFGNNIFEWMSRISLGILFFMLPLYFTGFSMQGVIFEKQLLFFFLILLALIGWIVKGVMTGSLTVKRTPLDLALVGFVVTYIVSTIASVDRWHSFWGFFGDPSRGLVAVLGVSLAYFMIVNISSRAWLKRYGIVFAVSCFIFSVWTLLGVLNFSWVQGILAKGIPRNLLGETSQSVGLFLAFSLPVLLSILLLVIKQEGQRKLWKVFAVAFFGLAVAVNLVVMCIIFDAVPTIALIVGLVVFLAFILGGIVEVPQGVTWIPALIFALVLAFAFTDGFNLSQAGSTGSVPEYSAYWKVTQSAGLNNFFLGSGPATYGYVFTQYHPKDLNDSMFSGRISYQSRGVLFEIFSSLGAFGAVFFCLLVLTFIGACIYMLSKEWKGKIFSLGLFSASMVFIVASMMMRIEGAVLLIGALILSLTMASMMLEPSNIQKEKTFSLKASPKYALSLAFLFIVASAIMVYAFVFVGKMYAADLYAGSALREKEITEEGSVNKLSKAILLSDRREGRYMTRLGQEYVYLANQEVLKGDKDMNMDVLKNKLDRAIQWAELGHQSMDKDILGTEALAQVYESSSRYVSNAQELSLKYYQQAHELNPNSPVYFLKLGEAKLAAAATEKDDAQKKSYVEEAKEYFQQAVDKQKSYSFAHYDLGLAYEALGDLDNAIANVQDAFFMENRANIVYAYNLARIMSQRGSGTDYKNAENLFKDIIAANDNEVNAHFNLGLLYEKTNRRNEASGEYKKIIELLGTGYDDVRARLQKMTDNIRKGIENTPENLNVASPATAENAMDGSGVNQTSDQLSPTQTGQ